MDTFGLSHPRAITRVSDPVHDSIRLSCFDRDIVDSAYFQRLHFVLQNSTSYVAFPSNKNSRFSHSLGVAHLCGRMLTSALSNASYHDLDLYLQNVASFLKKQFVTGGDGTDTERLTIGWEQTISGQSQFRHSPFLKVPTPDDADELNSSTIHNDVLYEGFLAGFIVDTLWQTLRICGLAHDIGHLPMSHSLEGALEKLDRSFHKEQNKETNKKQRKKRRKEISDEFAEITGHEQYAGVIEEHSDLLKNAFGKYYNEKVFYDELKSFPLHEKRSLFILNLLMQKDSLRFEGRKRDYRILLYKFSFLILFSTIRSEQAALAPTDDAAFSSFFKVLKLIVAGAVDGDRMDYTIRDGLSCGSTIGKFDLSRIIENSILYRDKIAQKPKFRIGFFNRSLSGVEQFFTQRHQGYKYLIYHRTASRSEACLQELVCQILQFCFKEPNHKFTEIVEKFGYIERRNDGRKFNIFPTNDWALRSLDDCNLRTLLSWLDHLIESERSSFNEDSLNDIDRISSLIKIILFRQFIHVFDPLKNTTLTGRIRKILGDSYDQDEYLSVLKLIAFSEETRLDYIRDAEAFFAEKLPSSWSVVISVQLPKIYDHERSKRKGEEVYILNNPIDENGVVPAAAVTEGSPTLDAMFHLFCQEFKINCYFVGNEIKKSQTVSRECGQHSDLDTIFDEFLLISYKELCSLVK